MRDKGHSENQKEDIMSKTTALKACNGRFIKPVLFWTLSIVLRVSSGGLVIRVLA
jgi:hypothetical protein